MFRTASAAGENASSDTVYINVEVHSIAFSALYFWIIPVVFLGSVIGVSQTEAAIPRILRRFQGDIDRLELPKQLRLPNGCLDDAEQRMFHGGIYSWQPQKNRPSHNRLSYAIVMMGTATGMAISALVPPEGWDCRHIGEGPILIAWLLSAQIDGWLSRLWPLKEENLQKLFWSTSVKDVAVTIATMGGVVYTQLGLFNRCSCYTLGGKTGLALPEMPDVAQTLFYRLNTVYPGIAFACIGIELIVVPLFICISYRDALRTFIQRDDRKSNAIWLWNLSKKYRAAKVGFENRFKLRSFGLSKGSRTRTGLAEEGGPGDAFELQPLTRNVSGNQERTTENDHHGGTSATDGQPGPTVSNSQSSSID